jgi:predicted short-subunit dehydrogenase-like oxidoreductase (DUF2520 family)
MRNEINKIVFVGSGNVATRLACEFQKAGKEIVQIVGRTESCVKKLAQKLEVDYTTDFKKIKTNADLYVLSVTDDALNEVAKNLDLNNQLVVHTSGTTSVDVLNRFNNFGIFYPLQTFSAEKQINFNEIPICIEANSDYNKSMLEKLGKLISGNVQYINSEQRRILHVGAVFVNNFTNYLYAISEDILKDYDLSFEILKPLIAETANKLKAYSPFEAQTGPARRNDQEVIKNHLDILDQYPEYRKVYQLLSDQLTRKHHKE